jgi:hypothetical protein
MSAKTKAEEKLRRMGKTDGMVLVLHRIKLHCLEVNQPSIATDYWQLVVEAQQRDSRGAHWHAARTPNLKIRGYL